MGSLGWHVDGFTYRGSPSLRMSLFILRGRSVASVNIQYTVLCLTLASVEPHRLLRKDLGAYKLQVNTPLHM
jgi:hypothetical protein